jgi:hypothetical protein
MKVREYKLFSKYSYAVVFFFLVSVFIPCLGTHEACALDQTAQPPAGMSPMKAVITHMSGQVTVQPNGATDAHPAKVGEALGGGDKVETLKDGVVEIALENDNVINLKPGSNLTLSTLTYNSNSGVYVNQFYSSLGKIRARVEKMGNKSTFEVTTPTAVAAVRGTVEFLSVTGSGTKAAFFDGIGYVTNPVSGKSEAVGDGEEVNSDASGTLSEPTGASDQTFDETEKGWEAAEVQETEKRPTSDTFTEEPREPQRPEGSNYTP